MIVVDTNVIAYFWIPGDFSKAAAALYDKDSHWISPYLWRSEFRNILSGYLRQKALTVDQALSLIENAESLMSGNEYNVSSAEVLEIAAASGCSAYDCEFVALARYFDVKLFTADKKVIREFPDAVVPLMW